MHIEDVKKRAAIHAALGEPVRLAIVEALRLSDQSPSSLRHWLGIDSNLLAHHLDVLEGVGVIERIPSSGDRRRKYVKLTDHTLENLFPAAPLVVKAILFICTHNSARSQLAAALWNCKSTVYAESAGTHPADRVHPLAVTVAARHGIDLSAAVPRHLSQVTRQPDLVVTVCDRANERLAPAEESRIHWSIPDPAETGTAEAFEAALRMLDQRITVLVERVSGN
ncbi:MAG: helix-turn-helix domain-containing protein [Pyrinomonadaceae bacterium]|nr:helix-turn-helix domain-containing protein [Pyrinomonadaceae bacterium]